MYLWILGHSEDGCDPDFHEICFFLKLWEILDYCPYQLVEYDSDLSDEELESLVLDINHLELDIHNGYNMEVRTNGHTVPEFCPKDTKNFDF